MVATTVKLNLTSNAKVKLFAQSFNFMLFYALKTVDIKETLCALRKLKIKYLYVSNVTWVGGQTMRLKGQSLILFTQDLSTVNDVQIIELQLHLYLLSVKGYFLNTLNLPLSTIFMYSSFYTNNYYFIIQYLILFYRT